MSEELKRWHAVLHAAYGQVKGLVHAGTATSFPPGISNMSLVALGEAMGVLSRARAMLGRDIDDLANKSQEVPSEPEPDHDEG